MLAIALFQPDIPGNTGTILRMAACLGLGVELIEPAGFDASDRALRRAAMDYAARTALRRHSDWSCFEHWRHAAGRRLVVATTQASMPYASFRFRADDIVLFGRESAGVPQSVHVAADMRVGFEMLPGARSLNVAVACAMIIGEALRQTRWTR